MTITPASVDGFPKTGRPWNNITPFTYRDGLTYLEVLEALRAYVRDYLVQHINDEMNGLVDDWQEQVTIIENAVSDALAQHSQEMHELADRWMQEQIENNDEITANILALSSSLTKTALEPVLAEYVAQSGVVRDAVDNRARTSVEQAVVGNTTLRDAVDNRARTSVEEAVVGNTTLRDAVDTRARTSVEEAVNGDTPLADAVSGRAVSSVNSAITEPGELSDTLKQETLNTAAEGATIATAFRNAIDQRVTVGTADAISTALADSQTLEDAAVAAMSDAGVQAQLAWNKRRLTAADDLTTLPFGAYHVTGGGDADALGLPAPRQGVVEIMPYSTVGRVIRFTTNDHNDSMTLEIWARTNTGSGAWTRPWRQIYPVPAEHPPATPLTEDDTLTELEPGDYTVSNGDIATALGLPVVRQGVVEVRTYSTAGRTIRFTTNNHNDSMSIEVWMLTNTGSGAWTRPWQKLYPSAGTDDGYDIILDTGQSNASGGGDGDSALLPSPRIFQFPAAGQSYEGTIVPATMPLQHKEQNAGAGVGPGMAFAVEWAKSHPGRKVLIVPAARSGSAFASTSLDPAPAGYYTASTGTWDRHLTTDPRNYALNALQQLSDAITAAGPGSRVVAATWVQGEGDSGHLTEAEYRAKAVDLFEQFRVVAGDPELPIIVGQMNPDNIVSEGRKAINRAHVSIPDALPRSAFAYAPVGLSNFGDATHFSARAQELIGAGFMRAYGRAVRNVAGEGPIGVEALGAVSDGTSVEVSWEWPSCRVGSYLIEWATDGVSWQSGATQDSPWDCAAVISESGVKSVRVRVVNSVGTGRAVETRVLQTS